MWEGEEQKSFFGDLYEKMIPKDDLYRRILEQVPFSFVNELAKPFYSDLGAEGYPPEKLFKMLLVMYLQNVSSERALEEEVKFNIRYRYFCGFCDPQDKIPDHSTFSRFRMRLGDRLFKEIFERVVSLCIEKGLASAKHISVDSTSVLADCAMPEYRQAGKGKGHIPSESPVDPDARWGKKSPGRAFFGYKAHSAVDSKSGLILNTEITGANRCDHEFLKPLLDEIVSKHEVKVSHVAADKAYDTLKDRKYIKEELLAVSLIPQRNIAPNKGYFAKEAFTFNSDGDLICPSDRRMRPLGFWKSRETYVYRGRDCRDCRLRSRCTPSEKERSIQFQKDELIRALDRQFNQSAEFKELYRLRASVERMHGDGKQNHHLHRARYRGLRKVRLQVYLTAIAMNVKKMVKLLSQARPDPPPKTQMVPT